jgi:hypothetical protein
VINMLGVLKGRPLSEGPDYWSWKHISDGVFSVHSMYRYISQLHVKVGTRVVELSCILVMIWKSIAPFKVQVFSWELLLDGILTRVNFLRRRVLRNNEATLYDLSGCVEGLVYNVFMWLGWELVFPMELLWLFEGCYVFPVIEKVTRGFLLSDIQLCGLLLSLQENCHLESDHF